MKFPNLFLLSCFAFRQLFWKFLSKANLASFPSFVVFIIHSSPIVDEISFDSDGFERTMNRRGVTPFVLLLNFSGQRSLKSFNMVSFNNLECSSATPLIFMLPTQARFAIRTCFSGPSSISESLDILPSSPGYRVRACSRNRLFIS